jgi:two-component system sensor histidine kinase/response regulator
MTTLPAVLFIGRQDDCEGAICALRQSLSACLEIVGSPAEAVSSLRRQSWPLVVFSLSPSVAEACELARTFGSMDLPHAIGARWGVLPFELGGGDGAAAAALARSSGLDFVLPASGTGPEWQQALRSVLTGADGSFDENALIERMMGNQQLARLVVHAFLLDVPQQLVALEQALAMGDARTSARAAHSIRGAAANAGSDGLVPLARKLEEALNAGDLDFGRRLLPELAGSFSSLRPRLERFCS